VEKNSPDLQKVLRLVVVDTNGNKRSQ
jgi:hypothetical protein